MFCSAPMIHHSICARKIQLGFVELNPVCVSLLLVVIIHGKLSVPVEKKSSLEAIVEGLSLLLTSDVISSQ